MEFRRHRVPSSTLRCRHDVPSSTLRRRHDVPSSTLRRRHDVFLVPRGRIYSSGSGFLAYGTLVPRDD